MVITQREVYDAVITLTGRVDMLIAQHDALSTKKDDHEERLRGLERARWPLPSVAMVVSLIALIVGAVPYFSS